MMEGVKLAQFAAGSDIQTLIQSEFFAFAIPFLLTFAVVYGMLTQVDIPKDKHPRVIIGLVAGFLVLPTAPQVAAIIGSLSSGLVIAIGAFLMLVVLFEVLGLKGKRKIGKEDTPDLTIFEAHYRMFLFLIVIIVTLIFANSGGFAALGIPTPTFLLSSPLVFFLIFVVAIVLWVSAQEGDN